ncbi:MAG: 3-oxoacid CoA-transferase subunit B, partial [Chloroflexi bacterium]|nr:3-oxoacid CoA-transferase subunit B [Chloroflexota bacterium]
MKQRLTRELICLRIAKELKDGMYVNLGFGMPTLVSNFISPDAEVLLHAENGVLNYGQTLTLEDDIDVDLVNAGCQPIKLRRGACFFDFATSFGMVRGGHIDVAVLGAYQVSEKGDLANWRIPGQRVGGIGGGMELAAGCKRIIVAMEHTTKSGEPRIVSQCSYPLTAKGVVKTIVTDLAY